MVSYTRLNVVVLTFITTCLIWFGINLMFISITNYIGENENLNNVVRNDNSIENTTQNTTQNTVKNTSNNTVQNKVTNKATNTTQNQVTNTTKNRVNNTTKPTNTVNKISNLNEWSLVIPKISLNAPIAEGTTSKVMDEYIGHFENTATLEGNIGLAAHNRGYPVNYFQNIKKLEKGDVIEYFCGNIKKEYKVETVTIISDTDWTYLAQTKENKITLITCVEDEPNYRRCIQAVEIE